MRLKLYKIFKGKRADIFLQKKKESNALRIKIDEQD